MRIEIDLVYTTGIKSVTTETISPTVNEILEKGCGYYLDFHFQKNETIQLLEFIREQWLSIIQLHCPIHWKKFSNIDIKNYHQFSHLLDHAATWSKTSRIFPKEIVKQIRAMSVIKKLEKAYGSIQIADEENIGYEEIDWRLVRPNQPGDVGPFHADAWFLELGHGVTPPKDMKAIKVWVALFCEPNLNGLKVVPHSQKKEWRYHGEFRHKFVKPHIDEDEASLPAILLNTSPGDVVVFHDKLLHAGALNHGKYTRISMEFMVFVKR